MSWVYKYFLIKLIVFLAFSILNNFLFFFLYCALNFIKTQGGFNIIKFIMKSSSPKLWNFVKHVGNKMIWLSLWDFCYFFFLLFVSPNGSFFFFFFFEVNKWYPPNRFEAYKLNVYSLVSFLITIPASVCLSSRIFGYSPYQFPL